MVTLSTHLSIKAHLPAAHAALELTGGDLLVLGASRWSQQQQYCHPLHFTCLHPENLFLHMVSLLKKEVAYLLSSALLLGTIWYVKKHIQLQEVSGALIIAENGRFSGRKSFSGFTGYASNSLI